MKHNTSNISSISTSLPLQTDKRAVSPRRLIVKEKRDEILTIVRKHHGLSAELFGSVAIGDDDEHSDIDILVTFTKEASLLDTLYIERELIVLLGYDVDVVSAGALTRRDDHIRQALVTI
jgi:hypothetical protein